MNMRFGLLRLLLLLAVAGVLEGCTHSVIIRSTPPGARVRIDGSDVGETPFFFEETTGWSKTYKLELEKDGFESRAEKLEQNVIQWRYACPAVCLCAPTLGLSLTGLLYSFSLGNEYNYVLVPLDDSARPEKKDPIKPDDPASGQKDAQKANPPADAPRKKNPEEDDTPAVVPF